MKKSSLFTKLAFVVLLSGISLTLSYAAQDTYLISMTEFGGTNNEGAIIKYNLNTNTEQVVWNFGNGSDGQVPSASLTYYPGNNLYYGMTEDGGIHNNKGVIFSFDPANDSEVVVYNFDSTNGANPIGDLVYVPATGLLYGLTLDGGVNDAGAIISFDPATGSEALLYSFLGGSADGSQPHGDMIYDATNGFFYGMTSGGGTGTQGVIFKFDPVSKSETVIHNFGSGTDQGPAYGSFALDPDDSLYYGMTFGSTGSSGTIIRLNPASNSESVVYTFGGTPDAASPEGALVYDTARALFLGLTYNGGANGQGAIISFNPVTTTETVLWSFGSDTDGTNPNAQMVYDASTGKYYGVTSNGGSSFYGIIFKFDPATSAETVLYNFRSSSDGNTPTGTPILYTGSSTGIPTVSGVPTISIYPNPTNAIINISGLIAGQTIEVYDYLGQRVSSSISVSTSTQINLTSHEYGVYLVTILNADGSIAGEKKVVKQN